jgi:hypothetical protein
MPHYSSDGRILTFTVVAPSVAPEMAAIFQAIRDDATVPLAAPLLLDVRAVDWVMDEATMRRHFRGLHHGLGRKLGAACAVLTKTLALAEHHWFRDAADGVSLRLGFFDNETDARRWLEGYVLLS